MAEEYERVQYVAQEVFLYRIPPRVSTTRAARADDWNLASPDWKGRLKIVAIKEKCVIKLEERSGELFAVCPVDSHPGVAVEAVSDSSRYFVLKLEESSGRHAFIGLGFQDRGDSFDFNVALHEHFKGVKRDLQIAQESSQPQTHIDYSLKSGQKISLNLSKKLHDEDNPKPSAIKPLAKPPGSSGGIFLPPPPAGGKPIEKPKIATNDDFGDFMSGGDSSKTTSTEGGDWVQF